MPDQDPAEQAATRYLDVRTAAEVFKAVLWLCLCFTLGASALVAIQLGKSVQETLDHVNTVTDHINATADAATLIVGGLNAPCSGPAELHRCGTLAQLNRTLVAGSDAIKHADELTGKESATIDAAVLPLVARTNVALGNVEQATADIHPLLTTATERVAALEPIEADAAHMILDVDTTVRDPDVGKTLNALEQASEQLAITSRETTATMGSVQAMAKDGQDEVHSLTHPKPLVSIADWTLKVVHAVGGFF